MLDSFLEVLVKNEDKRLQTVKLANDLKRLPNETLYGIATGKQKLAFGYSDEWLEKYKGTPLFEQAMALEKADLEAEISREQANAVQPDMSQFWKTQDQIRLQKKMLDLQLIELNEKDGLQMQPGGMLPESITPAAQGAGALGDVAAEGAQQGEAAKMAAANFEKAAFDLQGLGTTALNFAKKNPGRAGAAVGAGIGAVGGALGAARDPQTGEKHWVRGALGGAAGGAALGGAAGHAGMGIGKRLNRGASVGDALKGYGTQVKRPNKPAPTPAAAPAPAAAPPPASPHLDDIAKQDVAAKNIAQMTAGTNPVSEGLFAMRGGAPVSFPKYSSAGIKMKIAFIRMNSEG